MEQAAYWKTVFWRCCLAVCSLTTSNYMLAADVLVGASVPISQRVPLDRIDHKLWDGLLKKYVDQHGRVAYAAWKRSAADVQALDQYLRLLSTSDGTGDEAQQLAFWINAYNALTIKGILREYPTSSIRNHTAIFFGYNIWKNLKLNVAGKPISLYDIEHQVLRKMEEPRIHFAIVCASIGCPKLLNEAYQAEKADAQLTAAAKAFFADKSKFRYDSQRGIFYISPILDWFAEDFGNSQAAQLQRIAAWLPVATAQQAAASGTGSISFVTYDWGLNDRN